MKLLLSDAMRWTTKVDMEIAEMEVIKEIWITLNINWIYIHRIPMNFFFSLYLLSRHVEKGSSSNNQTWRQSPLFHEYMRVWLIHFITSFFYFLNSSSWGNDERTHSSKDHWCNKNLTLIIHLLCAIFFFLKQYENNKRWH